MISGKSHVIECLMQFRQWGFVSSHYSPLVVHHVTSMVAVGLWSVNVVGSLMVMGGIGEVGE